MSIVLIYLYLNKKNGGFFLLISFLLLLIITENTKLLTFFKVTMVTFNDLHPLTNL